MVVRLSDISSKTGKKCTFCVFRLNGMVSVGICGKPSLECRGQHLFTALLSIPFNYLPSVVHQELQGLNEVLPWASSDWWSFNNYVDMILSLFDQLKVSKY